jgi:hypothetical protein
VRAPRIESIFDGVKTRASAVGAELAALSDPDRTPRLRRAISETLAPNEEFIVSLIKANMTIRAIYEESPLSEKQTMHVIAKLIRSGCVTLLS